MILEITEPLQKKQIVLYGADNVIDLIENVSALDLGIKFRDEEKYRWLRQYGQTDENFEKTMKKLKKMAKRDLYLVSVEKIVIDEFERECFITL